ncbi:hypothetical protein HPB48_018473 [Haemaphysalis longicornis]|uniref:Uncharacterized protein n=1 Tax=Haemaphysalis longicornis TaxID=44386 RepID=A0A9J6GE70_HAELO|nr:hypothetical protein HPB48_018473 [Haemaphysalis longicornis]
MQAQCASSSYIEKLEAIDVTISNKIAYSGSCISKEIPRQPKLTEAFDGREVVLACLPLNSVLKNYTLCNYPLYNVTLQVLETLNATVKFRFYADFASAKNALFEGNADIMFHIVVFHQTVFNDFFFPEILEFRHWRFYVWKGKASVSFVTFVARSWPALISLLVATTAALMTLNFRQCLERRRYGCFRATGDWAMFKLASLFAIPAHLPDEFAGSSGGRYKRSQEVMIVVWLLGLLPLSAYFRGELTSSLAVIIPPDPIDTVRELEEALDQGKLHPCISNQSRRNLFLNDSSESSNEVLLGKLRAAFEQLSKTVQLNFADFTDCLESCATKPGFACFLYALGDCYLKSNSWPYIESQDELGLALISTPVRKDFPLAKQYNKITRRIFETALNPYAFNFPRRCLPNRPVTEYSTAIPIGSKKS